MEPEIVVPGPDDFVAAMTPVWQSFAMSDLDAETLTDERVLFDASRPLAARVDGQWVGAVGDFPLELTLPGGATVPVAGVTMVGVAPTHRRQGLLTKLMARQLDDIDERGEMIAILTASESVIYGRFGYAPATVRVQTVVETARAGYLVDAPASGRCRLLAKADALPMIKTVYDACRSHRAGAVRRDDWWWHAVEADRPGGRQGASALFFVVHEDAAGHADGYATYRIKEEWGSDTLPRGELIVREVYGASADVDAALWRFLFDIDLVESVQCWNRPIDDPLRWRLAEPRRMRTMAISDWLWLRVMDVPRALEARAYEGEGEIVLEIVDPFRPAAGGRFRLEAGPDGAACKPTDETADLSLGAAAFAAVYLGGVKLSLLAEAGRVDQHSRDAVARADTLFTTQRLPWANTGF